MIINVDKLKRLREKQALSVEELAKHLVRSGLVIDEAKKSLCNWEQGLFKPRPKREDLQRLASALGVELTDICDWCSSYKYAPFSASKARLVSQLIIGRRVQDAMDTLKFTSKRAAPAIYKVLKAAVADADEQQADTENLYVSIARVDEAGVRIGTKRWIPKDRGRAHPIRKKACHIHVTVTQV